MQGIQTGGTVRISRRIDLLCRLPLPLGWENGRLEWLQSDIHTYVCVCVRTVDIEPLRIGGRGGRQWVSDRLGHTGENHPTRFIIRPLSRVLALHNRQTRSN